MIRRHPFVLSLVFVPLLTVALPGTAHSTWSIVIVDQATGEVGVATASCIGGDIKEYVPVLRVGYGGGAAQFVIKSDAGNRKIIYQELRKGTDPSAILALIIAADPLYQSRQFGIVDRQGRALTFTGTSAASSKWAGGLTGSSGSLSWAIQGNTLAGPNVVDDAETAILTTPGDLAEKLMAAMEASMLAGGDKRCASWGKTAHVGCMSVARLGDLDGVCNGFAGCMNGSYYMDLNAANLSSRDPDPVLVLRGQFNAWRASWIGRPDHNLSTAALADATLPGNGTATTNLHVELIDWQGFPLNAGGANVVVQHASNSGGRSTIGRVIDHGDGTYDVPITAGVGQGADRFEVWVDDGQGAIRLNPTLKLRLTNTLDRDLASVSAASGGAVQFALTGPESAAGRTYALLASGSGTSPGLPVGPVILPLNYDGITQYSVAFANGPEFVNTAGMLAPDGTASAQFVAPAAALQPLIGLTMSFAYLTFGPVDFASNAVGVLINP